ncbi:hypothetical protein NB716_001676 [Pantoea ananatis]|nr:hypothetical protein [Pantoea ananatis]
MATDDLSSDGQGPVAGPFTGWLAGCLLWNPARYASGAGGIVLWQGVLLIWAVCTGVIYGVGFRPRRFRWRALFTPLPALVILLWGVSRFYL